MAGRRRHGAGARACVVMGVAGCGKSAVGSALAAGARLAASSKATGCIRPKMSSAWRAGCRSPTTHRWGWLDAIGGEIALAGANGHGAVAACSALKRAYRDRLRGFGEPASCSSIWRSTGDRGAARRRAQGPFHAGEPGRQPVRRPGAAGARRAGRRARCAGARSKSWWPAPPQSFTIKANDTLPLTGRAFCPVNLASGVSS